MQLGLTPWSLSDNGDARALCEQAMFGEQLGYEYFVLPEHHFIQGRSIPDPLLLLAAVSATTHKIRLGTTSYLLPVRHPVQAAEQVAVLDQLSNGRLTLGIGRGSAASLFRTFGVDAKKKRSLFEDCFRQMVQAWLGEPVSSDDDGESVSISPLPRQTPHPPIWIAAFGPLALKQAGRLGLPYLASPRETKSRLASNYAIQREACEIANMVVPTQTPIMRSVFISEDRSLVRSVRNQLEKNFSTTSIEDSHSTFSSVDDWALVGSMSQIRDVLASYTEMLNISHLIATRLGIGGVPRSDIQKSLGYLAQVRDELAS